MKKIILFISIFACIGKGNLFAQFDTVYVNSYGGPGDEPPGFGTGFQGAPVVRIVADEAGNVYTLTFTNSSSGDIVQNAGSEDILLIKTSAEGQTQWVKTYGGSSFERAYSLKLLSDGSILIAGKTASNNGIFSGFLGLEDAFLLKLNSDGEVVWSRNYGGSQIDSFFDVIELPEGDLIACGISGSIDGDINDASFAGSNKAWIIRLNPSGEPVWSKITNGIIVNDDWEESFWHIKLNGQNNMLYALGASYNFNDINSDDLLLCTYSLTGDPGIKRVYGGNAGDSPAGLEVLTGGDLLIFSTIRGSGNDISQFSGGNADAWLVRINNAGEIIWDRNYGGTDLDYAYGMALSAEGQASLCLSSRSTNETAQAASYGLLDGLLIQIDIQQGDTVFTKRWGSSGADYAHDIVWAPDFSWFVSAGRSSGSDGFIQNPKGGTDVVLVKYLDATASFHGGFTENEIKVYPNPSGGKFYLSSPSSGFCSIYNTSGRLIFQNSINEGKSELELPYGLFKIVFTPSDAQKSICKTILIMQ
jgi:hypothetical protein